MESVTVNGYNLDSCRIMARNNYPEIKRYELIENTKQFNLSNAAKGWIPQVTLSAQASWQSVTPTLPESFNNMMAAQGAKLNGLKKDQYRISVDINQQIWDGGVSRANRSIAEADANEQSATSDVELYSLDRRVDDLYFGILLLEERIEQTSLKITLLQSNLNRINSLVDNGVAMQVDADAVEAELLLAYQTLKQLEISKNSYRAMLEFFIGCKLHNGKLEKPIDIQVPDNIVKRPELHLFDAKSNALDLQKRIISVSTKPKFYAFIQGGYGYPSANYFESMITGSWKFNVVLGVKMLWNFGAYYTKNNNLKKIDITKQQIELQRDIFIFNTNLQIAMNNGEINRLRESVALDEKIVTLKRNIRISAEAKIQNGIIDTFQLLQKITDEADAMLNRSLHKIQLLQSIYEIKHTINQ